VWVVYCRFTGQLNSYSTGVTARYREAKMTEGYQAKNTKPKTTGLTRKPKSTKYGVGTERNETNQSHITSTINNNKRNLDLEVSETKISTMR